MLILSRYRPKFGLESSESGKMFLQFDDKFLLKAAAYRDVLSSFTRLIHRERLVLPPPNLFIFFSLAQSFGLSSSIKTLLS